MAYNKNFNLNQNNVANISGSIVTITGSLYGSEISGTTSQFTTVSASVVSASTYYGLPTLTGSTQQLTLTCINKSGAGIPKGKVVHITSSGNNSDTPNIILASWSSDSLSANTLGVTMETIADNATGSVILTGMLTQVPLSGTYTEGQTIYLSSSGGITPTKPSAPLHEVRIGQVTRTINANNNTIFVRVQNGYELDELHDVLITSKQNGDLLVWNSGSSVWNNSKSLSGSYTVTGTLIVTSDTTINGNTEIGNTNFTVYMPTASAGGGYSLILKGDATGGKILTNSTVRDLQLGTNNLTALTIDTSQRVGIGTTAPITTLDVRSGATSNIAAIANDSTAVVVTATATGAGGYTLDISADGTGAKIRTNSSARDLQLGTNSTTALTIDTSQRVGIGTSSPNIDSKLHISHPTLARTLITSNGDSQIQLESAGGSGGYPAWVSYGYRGTIASPNATLNGDTLGGFFFGGYNGTARTSRTTIEAYASENWSTSGIGSGMVFKIAPVASGDSTAEVIRLSPPTGSGLAGEVVINDSSRSDINFRVESDTNTHMLFVSASNDRVGIGTSSPNATLDVNGNTIVSGNLTVTGSISELSTRRIKTDINSLNNQLTTINKLNPVSYTRIDDGRKEYGFISEEVREVYPEFVVGEGINYPKMVSVLVSSIKELTQKLEDQQKQIDKLKISKKRTTRGKK